LFTRTGEDGTLSKDAIFSMLSNRRRRLVLHHLSRTEDPSSVRELSQQVAMWENDVTMDELTYKQRKRVYTSLHQTHLPKLDDVGVVVYDRDRGTVELTETAGELQPYLNIQTEPTESWSVYYLALAGLSTLVVCCAWAGLFPFSLFSGFSYAALVTLVFAVSATIHTYQIRKAVVDQDAAPPNSARPETDKLSDLRTDPPEIDD
jgi:hypothetical protein